MVDSKLDAMYQSPADKQERYDQWADSYESDLVEQLGYVAHIEVVARFCERVSDRNAAILDMGCGTGLVGDALRQEGYSSVDGADFSIEMLTIARERNVYDQIYQYDAITDQPQLRTYDAIVSVGLFGFGPPHVKHLNNVLKYLQPGGSAFVTMNGKAWVEKSIESELQSIAADLSASLLDIQTIDYITKENIDGRLLEFRGNP
ncbi:MAG: methyltransferase domain-containing protein [Pseudomonadota bacterium]